MISQTWTNLLELLGDFGFFGIAVALMIEVIPSEIVLSYAGFLVDRGKISFPVALLAGVTGGTIAQLFLYWLGIYGGRPFFNKYGKYFLIQPKHIEAGESWFHKHGTIVIFTARFIPVVRHAISIPAGIARMPVLQFTIYTAAAMIPWTVLFLLIGIQLGQHWDTIGAAAGPYIKPIVIIAAASLLIYLLAMRRKRRTK